MAQEGEVGCPRSPWFRDWNASHPADSLVSLHSTLSPVNILGAKYFKHFLGSFSTSLLSLGNLLV